MKKDISSKIFYHIYPLGMCGAPKRNDFASPPGNGLRNLEKRIPHLRWLGVNAVYIGPLFESTAHGYDTVDYYHVDRRLGTDEDLIALVQALHEAGIAVVLDAVRRLRPSAAADFEFVPGDFREKSEYRLIVSKKYPGAADLLKRFDQGMQAIVADGTFKAIAAKYGLGR